MWIDAIILAIFLFFLWRGYEKGFLKNFLYLIGWIISLIIAVRFWEPVQVVLEEHLSLAADFTKLIQDKLMALAEAAGGAEAFQTVIEEGNGESLFMIPSKAGEWLWSSITNLGTITSEPVAALIADFCLGIIAFLVVVFLAKIATSVIIRILEGFIKLPIIGTANALLGAAMGALKGIILIMLLLMFLMPVFTVTDNELLIKAYDNAVITPYLYEKNPIFLFWKG